MHCAEGLKCPEGDSAVRKTREFFSKRGINPTFYEWNRVLDAFKKGKDPEKVRSLND